MKNIDNITTKEEAHCFLTKEFANIAHLLTSKKNGLSKKIDSYMTYQDVLQKKFEMDVDLYTNAIKGILEIKSRQQDTFIENNIKELRDLNKEYENILDQKHSL